MSILKKRNILKLAATFMLVGMMVGTFAMHTKAAFAERATVCDSGTASASCTVAITFAATTDTSLSFTGGPATVPGDGSFTVPVTVADGRGTLGTAGTGWYLSARVDSATLLAVISTVATGTNCVAPSTGIPGAATGAPTTGCPKPTAASNTPLTSIDAPFLTAASGASTDTYGYTSFTVTGTLSAFGVASSGTATGNIVLSITAGTP